MRSNSVDGTDSPNIAIESALYHDYDHDHAQFEVEQCVVTEDDMAEHSNSNFLPATSQHQHTRPNMSVVTISSPEQFGTLLNSSRIVIADCKFQMTESTSSALSPLSINTC